MHSNITALKQATVSFLEAHAKHLKLATDQIRSIQPLQSIAPAPVPALDQIRGVLPETSRDTLPLCEALQQAAPHVQWRQTYTQADGFPKKFLDTYGWFDLAGPDGPYSAKDLRIMFGYWGSGLHYPDHNHAQEEHYVVLAGSAWFRLGSEPFHRLGPGQIFYTPPGAIHAAEMRDGPLLAMALWQAKDLTVQIHLTDSDRQVQVG